jgi:hypothetical protein
MRINNEAILLLCAAALIGACHRDSSSAPVAALPQVALKAPAKSGPSVAEQTAEMVEAVAQGKSPLEVGLKYELVERPTVGQVLHINVALTPQLEGGPASIKVSGGDGLTVAGDSNQFDLPQVADGGVYRETLNITPTDEGVLLLGVTVSVKHDEITDVKTFSIPIIADR